MEPIHSAPKGAITPAWTMLARAAFRDLLQSRKLDEFLGRSSRKRRPESWNLRFSDDDTPLETSSEPHTIAKTLPRLRLPWLPKEPVVAELLAIASLAAALSSKSAARRLLDPGQLVHVIMPLAEEEVGDIPDAIRGALSIWTGRNLDADDEKAVLKIYSSFELPDRSSKISSSGKSLRSRIEGHLREGVPVLLVTPTSAVPEPLQRHIGETLRCPRLTSEIAVAVIQTLHRGSARLGAGGIRDRLPDDHRLARLTGTQFEAALRLPDADALFGRLMQQTEVQSTSGAVTLKKVRGQQVAVGHLHRMLSDLQLWQAGGLDWSATTMSAVLYGPPGNGKTMLAAAFAGSAGVPLHVTSYADCQRHGHQGDMLKALHQAFQNAEGAVPCVLFMDEIDSFSARGRDADNDQYMRGVVNGLLMLLSRAVATPGLVLLAATNDLTVVDPAVIRPGRFDLKIPVLNPDRNGIRDILADHLNLEGSLSLSDADLDAISIELIGASGAAVAAAAREALSRARAEGRDVSLDDLMSVVRKGASGRPADYFKRLAVHEAGHVIVRTLSSLAPPQAVRVGAGASAVETPVLPFFTPETADEVLRELLAGRAAERVVMGTISSGAGEGASSDLAQATALAAKMEAEWGFSTEAPVWQSANTLMALGLPTGLRAAVQQRLGAAELAAEDLLRQHPDALLRLTDILLERRELAGQDLLDVLSDLGLTAGQKALVAASCGP
jgi:cell division protease FtsH